jgi:hypothetical protein
MEGNGAIVAEAGGGKGGGTWSGTGNCILMLRVDNFIYNKTKYCDGTGISALWVHKKGAHTICLLLL